jgi:putative transposase
VKILCCEQQNIKLDFIRPEKPTENARIECFNGSSRRELLDCYAFGFLSEVRGKAEKWMADYNYHRPHEALGDLSSIQFLEKHNLSQKLSV